jgi:para-aminobenzoate synthetase component II
LALVCQRERERGARATWRVFLEKDVVEWVRGDSKRLALTSVPQARMLLLAPMAPYVLVVDNYDSFTYNLVQYVGELGARVEVFKNDAIDVAGVRARAPDAVLISPGPCTPNEAGVSLELIAALGASMPIFGVCLGHQAIGQAFGGRVVRADRLMHGKTSPIVHDGRRMFEGLPSPFDATRYHSLLVERASLPDCLEVSAWTAEGEIMALRHRRFEVEGVQFHPESILTTHGKRLVANWVARIARAAPPEATS